MSTTKHTPGPWVIASPEYFDTGLLIQTEQGEPVAICEPTDALDANAALIAEAPNLLVALQGLVADWERVMGRPIPDDHEAKAAITAATGGAPPVWGEVSNDAEAVSESVVPELVDALNNLLAETVDRAREVGHELDAAQDEARTKAIAAIAKATGGDL